MPVNLNLSGPQPGPKPENSSLLVFSLLRFGPHRTMSPEMRGLSLKYYLMRVKDLRVLVFFSLELRNYGQIRLSFLLLYILLLCQFGRSGRPVYVRGFSSAAICYPPSYRHRSKGKALGIRNGYVFALPQSKRER